MWKKMAAIIKKGTYICSTHEKQKTISHLCNIENDKKILIGILSYLVPITPPSEIGCDKVKYPMSIFDTPLTHPLNIKLIFDTF